MDAAEARAYPEARARIIELVRDLDDDAAETKVPACPGWRVRDVVAHLGGSTTDVLTGNVDGYGTDAWTQRQVEERSSVGIDEIVKEWEGNADRWDRWLIEEAGFRPYVATADIATHEHDIRGALNRPGARDADGIKIGIKTYVGGLRMRMEGLPPLRVDAQGWRAYMVGSGEPAASVSAEPFELFRSLAARRTEEQVRAYEWDGDPTPYMAAWVSGRPFGWPAAALPE